MAEYEESLKELAGEYVKAAGNVKAHETSVTAATRSLEAVKEQAEKIARQLSKCVGGNIRRRCFHVGNKVVIVQFEPERANHVTVEELL